MNNPIAVIRAKVWAFVMVLSSIVLFVGAIIMLWKPDIIAWSVMILLLIWFFIVTVFAPDDPQINEKDGTE